MRHRRNTKKRGTQPFFCRPAWFLRTQQSALQCGGGKQYAAIKHGARVFPAFTPSRARVRRFRGITASTRSPIFHPAPAVSGETGIPNAFPPFRAHGNHRRIRCCNRLGEGGAGGEALLRRGPFFPQLPLSRRTRTKRRRRRPLPGSVPNGGLYKTAGAE